MSNNFSNINDYLQNMVKEAVLTHQSENIDNKNKVKGIKIFIINAQFKLFKLK